MSYAHTKRRKNIAKFKRQNARCIKQTGERPVYSWRECLENIAKSMRTTKAILTDEEMAEGWHWCGEFDGLFRQPVDEEDLKMAEADRFTFSCLTPPTP